MPKSGKGDSIGRGEKSRQGGNMEGAIHADTIERLLFLKLAALKRLANCVARPEEVDAHIIVKAMISLSKKESSPLAKAASAAILDFCYPEWRSKAKPEIIGHVIARRDQLVAKWRKDVLARDGHKCQSCGSTKKLAAHHILRWVDSPETRVVVANGITYCEPCHKTVPMGGLCGA